MDYTTQKKKNLRHPYAQKLERRRENCTPQGIKQQQELILSLGLSSKEQEQLKREEARCQ